MQLNKNWRISTRNIHSRLAHLTPDVQSILRSFKYITNRIVVLPSRSCTKVSALIHGDGGPVPFTVIAWTRTLYSVERCRSALNKSSNVLTTSTHIRDNRNAAKQIDRCEAQQNSESYVKGSIKWRRNFSAYTASQLTNHQYMYAIVRNVSTNNYNKWMNDPNGNNSIVVRHQWVRYETNTKTVGRMFTSDFMAATVSISHNAQLFGSFSSRLVANLVSTYDTIPAVWRRRPPVYCEYLTAAMTGNNSYNNQTHQLKSQDNTTHLLQQRNTAVMNS